MALPAALIPTGFALAAVVAWGSSDFVGGWASRRINAFVLTLCVNAGGLVLMVALAAIVQAPFPTANNVAWIFVGGISGGIGLSVLYRALSQGKMGLTAPLAAVLGAGVPTLFSIVTEGLPGPLRVVGFFLAGTGIWLISRAEDGTRPKGVGLAVLAGVGFSGFYLCSRQAGQTSAVWIAVFTRIGGLLVSGSVVLRQKKLREVTRAAVRFGVVAGFLDSLGTMLFVRASQTGRLDAAVVVSSLYPAVTVLLARFILKEQFSKWKALGMLAALAAVPLIAMH